MYFLLNINDLQASPLLQRPGSCSQVETATQNSDSEEVTAEAQNGHLIRQGGPIRGRTCYSTGRSDFSTHPFNYEPTFSIGHEILHDSIKKRYIML